MILQASSSAAGVKMSGLRMGLPKISRFVWNIGVDNPGVTESTNTGLGKPFGSAMVLVGTRLAVAGSSWAGAGELSIIPMAVDTSNTANGERNSLLTMLCILNLLFEDRDCLGVRPCVIVFKGIGASHQKAPLAATNQWRPGTPSSGQIAWNSASDLGFTVLDGSNRLEPKDLGNSVDFATCCSGTRLSPAFCEISAGQPADAARTAAIRFMLQNQGHITEAHQIHHQWDELQKTAVQSEPQEFRLAFPNPLLEVSSRKLSTIAPPLVPRISARRQHRGRKRPNPLRPGRPRSYWPGDQKAETDEKQLLAKLNECCPEVPSSTI
jgi:hypothetical protein